MKLAIDGLGKMGMQIAQKLAEGGHEVIAHNRSPEPIQTAEAFGAKPAPDKQDVVAALAGGPFVLWLMIPAEAVESELQAWLKLIPTGSLLIDGGNSDFRQTKKHAVMVAQAGSTLLDVGTSGGILGLTQGFSMMVGGEEAAARTLTGVFDTLAKPAGGWQYFGPSGAGHFVKMVHNAIEYGMMESLAEGYRVLREGPYDHIDLAAAGDVWQRGSIVASGLNSLAAEVFHENPGLEGASGYVAESGEARWTLEIAKEHAIALPAIQAAMQVRLDSQAGQTSFATKLLAELRNKFGGHAINKQ